MAYGIIKDNTVVDAKVADADFAEAQGWVELTGGAGIGWTFEDGTFSPPAPPAGCPGHPRTQSTSAGHRAGCAAAAPTRRAARPCRAAPRARP